MPYKTIFDSLVVKKWSRNRRYIIHCALCRIFQSPFFQENKTSFIELYDTSFQLAVNATTVSAAAGAVPL